MNREYTTKISYNEFLPWVVTYAGKLRMNKKALSIAANIAQKRLSDFLREEQENQVTKPKNCTAYYFVKYLKGLGMGSVSEFEEKSGLPVSDEQRKELEEQFFLDKDRERIRKIMDNKNLRRMYEAMVDNYIAD